MPYTSSLTLSQVLNVEEPGGKSYNVSGPSHMTEDLKALKAAGGGDKRL